MLKKIFLAIFLVFSLFNIQTSFAGDKINESDFEISVGTITPTDSSAIQDTTEKTVNFILGTIIQKLMIYLGSLSLIIMTIGGGYMIFYHGQDELLSKGKYIFMSGVIALFVALASYYMVSLLRYVLYS